MHTRVIDVDEQISRIETRYGHLGPQLSSNEVLQSHLNKLVVRMLAQERAEAFIPMFLPAVPDLRTQQIAKSEGSGTDVMGLEEESLEDLELTAERAAALKAIEFLRDKRVRATICPALRSLSDDARDVSKYIVPLLAGSAVLQASTTTFAALTLAWVVIITTRMGIATLCAGVG